MSLVFVYGTLKQGFVNEQYLADQKFLGRAVLFEPNYRLYEVAGNYKFPALVEVESRGYPVYGEVYDVSDICLQYIDQLEGVGTNLYKRGTSQVRLEDQRVVEGVITYLYCRDVVHAMHVGQVWPIQHLSIWKLVGKEIESKEVTHEVDGFRLWENKNDRWVTPPFRTPEELTAYCLRSPGKYGDKPWSSKWFDPRPTKFNVEGHEYRMLGEEESPFFDDEEALCEWAAENTSFFDGSPGTPREWQSAFIEIASRLEGMP